MEHRAVSIEQAIQVGLEHHQAGRLPQAEAIYRQVLQADPRNPEALHLLGVVAHQTGKHAASVELIDRALAVKPRFAEALSNRGLALHALERYGEALGSYDMALTIRPVYAEALYNRGLALQGLGRYQEAIDSHDRALAIKPDHADALNDRGSALQELGRDAESLSCLDRALAIRPAFAEAFYNRGRALQRLGRHEEAVASYDRALSIEPGLVEAWGNRSVALHELERHAEALSGIERALAIRPGHAESFYNRGNALLGLKRFEEAVDSYERALAINGEYVEALNNRGRALYQLGRYGEAAASFGKAASLRPGYAGAHWNEGLCRLVLGDLERGWEKYEWRWEAGHSGTHRREFPQPVWLGRESLAGKSLFLYAEQGLGDTIQFCRYVPILAKRGATVILEAQSSLLPLLQGLEGGGRLLAKGEPPPAFDYHCPLLSLPLALGTTLDSIPAAIPYLRADPGLVSKWRTRLGDKRGLRIGLAWSATNDNAYGKARSVDLARFVELLPAGAQCASLQKDLTDAEREMIAARSDIEHVGSGFADTAALVELMDIVVSVDTSIAHLAGAMGKRVWILVPFAGDWRWLVGREDSPWYPTARIFRQAAPGDWTGAIRRLKGELEGFLYE